MPAATAQGGELAGREVPGGGRYDGRLGFAHRDRLGDEGAGELAPLLRVQRDGRHEALLDPRDGRLAPFTFIEEEVLDHALRVNIAKSMKLWRARIVWRAGERATSPVAGFALRLPHRFSRVSWSLFNRWSSSPVSGPPPSRSRRRTVSGPRPSLCRSLASRIRSKESSGIRILPPLAQVRDRVFPQVTVQGWAGYAQEIADVVYRVDGPLHPPMGTLAYPALALALVSRETAPSFPLRRGL